MKVYVFYSDKTERTIEFTRLKKAEAAVKRYSDFDLHFKIKEKEVSFIHWIGLFLHGW